MPVPENQLELRQQALRRLLEVFVVVHVGHSGDGGAGSRLWQEGTGDSPEKSTGLNKLSFKKTFTGLGSFRTLKPVCIRGSF